MAVNFSADLYSVWIRAPSADPAVSRSGSGNLMVVQHAKIYESYDLGDPLENG